jgi:hypothetical protein
VFDRSKLAARRGCLGSLQDLNRYRAKRELTLYGAVLLEYRVLNINRRMNSAELFAESFQTESVGHPIAVRIGDISISIEPEDHLEVALVPSLVAFRGEGGSPDISIRVRRIDRIEPATEPAAFDSGSVWRLYDDKGGFCFDFQTPVLGNLPYKRLVIDQQFCRAELLVNGQYFGDAGPVVPLDYPLDELLIMHRLTQEKAIELHGTGIVRPNGEANLFVGHSGAGKSTTTRLWTATEDVEVLSDDRIIVRRDEKQQIPRFARNDKRAYKMRMYGTPWHGEAMFASPNSAPLSRIFVLEHGHGNVITPLSSSQAVAELFARSFVPFHRHEYVDSALVFLEELVDAVPVYRYAFEPDQRSVDKILHFHD